MSKVEKPSAFKNWINPQVVQKIAKSVSGIYPQFNVREFSKVGKELKELELKARATIIRESLHRFLPDSYAEALKILVRSAKDRSLKGFELWPYLDFIKTHGLEHTELSLRAMKELTELFSAEFAIRPFIAQKPKLVQSFFDLWVLDANEHVRRWISEGTRPRLPWGEKLANSIEDPSFGLKYLESLKFDESLYVRKSVANHLNDISKDHPERLVKTLTVWNQNVPREHSDKIKWITTHALRTLIKKGNPAALQLLGVDHRPKVKINRFKLLNRTSKLPGKIDFTFEIQSGSRSPQKLIIDYVIFHRKNNGTQSPKVFKLKSILLNPGQTVRVQKSHPIRVVTTRKYYSGEHAIAVQINGALTKKLKWELRT